MKKKPIFNLLKKTIKFFLKKYKIEGLDNIPSKPSILVGNHAHAYGPLFAELFFPYNRQTWCSGEIMNIKSAPSYMQKDFWGEKPKYSQWFYKILSYLFAPICVYAFKHASTIPVYKDNRGVITFKRTLESLHNGEHVIIFPENHIENNNIVNSFEQNFIDIAKIYYKKYKKELNFVPFYISPKLKIVQFGKPIKFNSNANIENERTNISSYLSEEITKIAQALPKHIVVPYANVKKKYYPKNKV